MKEQKNLGSVKTRIHASTARTIAGTLDMTALLVKDMVITSIKCHYIHPVINYSVYIHNRQC